MTNETSPLLHLEKLAIFLQKEEATKKDIIKSEWTHINNYDVIS